MSVATNQSQIPRTHKTASLSRQSRWGTHFDPAREITACGRWWELPAKRTFPDEPISQDGRLTPPCFSMAFPAPAATMPRTR